MKAFHRPALPVFLIVLGAVAAGMAFAQAAPPASIDGTVSAMTMSSLTLTAADGTTKKVSLPKGILVLERTSATLSDIKKGDAMGVTAHRAEGGELTATEINIFSAELWKVVKKGQWPMQQPGQIMTNALVTSYAARANGHTLDMKYKDVSTTIAVPDDTVIHRLLTKALADVKQGMHILVRGSANPDGSFKAASVSFEG
ncbi:MAG TPA: hypothetical protein VMV03_14305 [Spirochaetia bacterium]|nr:hypothetical protein [Spirochaetia bacterium]